MEDWPAWHPVARGMFTVRSAYKVAVAKRDALMGRDDSTSGSKRCDEGDFQWHKIWQINAPNEVWMFIWRLVHNSLPVKRNLVRRGVKVDMLCPMCKRLDEDCGHLFFKCKYAKLCWRLMNMEALRTLLEDCHSGKETINKIWTFDKSEQLKVIVLLWRWWSARNKVNERGKMLNLAEIQSSVLFYFSEFEKLSIYAQPAPKPSQPSWTPPSEDTYKINIDGSFLSGARTGGWGFVIRNYNGEMLAAGAGNIVYAASALQTEALAAYKSLQHASQLGMMNIILETDAAVLALALKSEEIDRSPIGSLTKQIRDLMQSEFNSCVVSVCNRTVTWWQTVWPLMVLVFLALALVCS
jgi:ribonuclease HI